MKKEQDSQRVCLYSINIDSKWPKGVYNFNINEKAGLKHDYDHIPNSIIQHTRYNFALPFKTKQTKKNTEVWLFTIHYFMLLSIQELQWMPKAMKQLNKLYLLVREKN